MNEKTHLDLFSGIGGFALAAKWNGYRTVGFCDNEPYAQAVLKKHWPEVPCHKDIREVRGDLYAGVTLLTGGFPCQPFSVAMRSHRKGKEDVRYLWPEMLRVIQEAKPTWIIGENVVGILNLALDQVCADLEGEGYEVEPIIIPDCSVRANHKRDRVWIMAHRCGIKMEECKLEASRNWSQSLGHNRERSCEDGVLGWESKERDAFRDDPRVLRMANGIPNRVDRIKGVGNAIVPQVASEIIRCINKIMEDNK
jgi:DNA (cytosine-5)-methyltransferase 1